MIWVNHGVNPFRKKKLGFYTSFYGKLGLHRTLDVTNKNWELKQHKYGSCKFNNEQEIIVSYFVCEVNPITNCWAPFVFFGTPNRANPRMTMFFFQIPNMSNLLRIFGYNFISYFFTMFFLHFSFGTMPDFCWIVPLLVLLQSFVFFLYLYPAQDSHGRVDHTPHHVLTIMGF